MENCSVLGTDQSFYKGLLIRCFTNAIRHCQRTFSDLEMDVKRVKLLFNPGNRREEIERVFFILLGGMVLKWNRLSKRR